MSPPIAELLKRLEAISRDHPHRVLRLVGELPVDGAAGRGVAEPFELLIFRGFSSSTTHPTSFDPDTSALPDDALIGSAELLVGPLRTSQEERLAEPGPVESYLDPSRWR